MKNASIISNVILGAAVIVLFILHFTSRTSTSQVESDNEGGRAQAGDIVYIQIDSLVSKYDMFNDLRSEFENKAQTIQEDLNKRGRAFENDIKEFQTKVQKGLITSSQAQQQQQQLQMREQELQSYAQKKQAEMSEEEAVIYRRVFDALSNYVEKLNQEKRYSLILSTSGTPSLVLNGDKALDITNEVIKGMNDEYIKNRSSK